MELCEAIQVQKVEIGNLELFSSLPRSFDVHVSDRYSFILLGNSTISGASWFYQMCAYCNFAYWLNVSPLEYLFSD